MRRRDEEDDGNCPDNKDWLELEPSEPVVTRGTRTDRNEVVDTNPTRLPTKGLRKQLTNPLKGQPKTPTSSTRGLKHEASCSKPRGIN